MLISSKNEINKIRLNMPRSISLEDEALHQNKTDIIAENRVETSHKIL